MATSTKKRLLDAYRFAGFRPLEAIKGVFGDPHARVVTLARRSKKRSAVCAGARTQAGTTAHAARARPALLSVNSPFPPPPFGVKIYES
ncbi:MAG: hypothetical protein AB7T14_10200, partial [Candidatus Methylacidiphilaceae bacterium]